MTNWTAKPGPDRRRTAPRVAASGPRPHKPHQERKRFWLPPVIHWPFLGQRRSGRHGGFAASRFPPV